MMSLKNFASLKFAKNVGLGYFIAFIVLSILHHCMPNITFGVILLMVLVFYTVILITSFCTFVFVMLLFIDVVEILSCKFSKKELTIVDENTNNGKKNILNIVLTLFFIAFYFVVSVFFLKLYLNLV